MRPLVPRPWEEHESVGKKGEKKDKTSSSSPARCPDLMATREEKEEDTTSPKRSKPTTASIHSKLPCTAVTTLRSQPCVGWTCSETVPQHRLVTRIFFVLRRVWQSLEILLVNFLVNSAEDLFTAEAVDAVKLRKLVHVYLDRTSLACESIVRFLWLFSRLQKLPSAESSK
ncbi:Hypothetical predicted protein [Lecanosticta acicola]|uniref:Uncharacterized protein n=1 Tax=Lecanosticta acicola TaxID=111012 RepID=A0AAI8Z8T4_9PEZI|nr:Hypothetical predicted protein [Lecanosticta acicola]